MALNQFIGEPFANNPPHQTWARPGSKIRVLIIRLRYPSGSKLPVRGLDVVAAFAHPLSPASKLLAYPPPAGPSLFYQPHPLERPQTPHSCGSPGRTSVGGTVSSKATVTAVAHDTPVKSGAPLGRDFLMELARSFDLGLGPRRPRDHVAAPARRPWAI
ncbi:hypothetical protein AB7M56_001789 [Bradyrhizobium elkanii]|uniref:Uncharacterized protein n=1 Tax=Bradyrhizobium elkanii TaxID=29448 RepID=A0ABV4F8T3_BRAEL|nr:hypothetical protein [Bradyrhizobium elkanii]MCP1976721.1 hypothetical protein [Bradyrhizobium elkanii]MCS3523885.1 hypothetical protein [Bradyrhizobium elkanii]MCS3888761.1 hypothetical protein [Bradyrhizobium elkanii]MCS4071541.1 hypothetical protein [Bradyrhizobium elkanii]